MNQILVSFGLILLVNYTYSQKPPLKHQQQQNTHQSSCSSLDLTPVLGDCSRFYRCDSNKLYVLNCPYGLMFDRRSRVCNYANQVNCPQPAPTVSPCGSSNCGTFSSTAPPRIGCSQSQDLTPVQGDCSRFVRCANNILYTFNCPSGLLFDDHLNVCNYATQVNCASCTSVSGCSSTFAPIATTSTPSLLISCSPNTDLTPVQDCVGFYKCIDNQLYMFNCPANYLFDTFSRMCLPSNQVSCNNFQTTPQFTNQPEFFSTSPQPFQPNPFQTSQQPFQPNPFQTSPQPFFPNQQPNIPNQQLSTPFAPFPNQPFLTTQPFQLNQNCNPMLDLTPVSNDCRRFYRCINNNLLVFQCPDGFMFDSLSRDCLPSNLVTCQGQNQQTPIYVSPISCTGPGCSTTQFPNANLCDLSKDLTSMPGDCTKFYKCVNNTLLTFNCLDGFLFDTISRGCQIASQATCSSSLNNNNNNNLNNNLPCDPSRDRTSVPGDCTRFYKCLDNMLMTLNCPNGYLFDSITRNCQIANLAVCQNTTNTNIQNTQPPCDPRLDLSPLPGDCGKFFKCINQLLYTFNCPSGYMFDVNSKECQAEGVAQCSVQGGPKKIGCDLSKVMTPVLNSGCKKFFRCLNNELVAFACPDGFLFDQNIKDCNSANLVTNMSKCTSTLNLKTILIKKTVSGTLNCNSKHLTKIDCNNYNYCLLTDLITLTCNQGKVFDSETSSCQPRIKVRPPCGTLMISNNNNVV